MKTGVSAGKGFRVQEWDGCQDWDHTKIHNLLNHWPNNEAVAYIVRNAVPVSACQEISRNFTRGISLHGSHRNDDGFVSVSQIGANQFTKTSEEYASECERALPEVKSLFTGINELTIDDILLNDLVKIASNPTGLRAAQFAGVSACSCSTRIWRNRGNLSLEPHEDCAQLAVAKRYGSEIGAIKSVIAQNLTIEKSGEGGVLRIWNLAPDAIMREVFDLGETGYPYPQSVVSNLDYIDIETNAGDVVFFAANFLHGVTALESGTRITMGRFLGRLHGDETVFWT